MKAARPRTGTASSMPWKSEPWTTVINAWLPRAHAHCCPQRAPGLAEGRCPLCSVPCPDAFAVYLISWFLLCLIVVIKQAQRRTQSRSRALRRRWCISPILTMGWHRLRFTVSPSVLAPRSASPTGTPQLGTPSPGTPQVTRHSHMLLVVGGVVLRTVRIPRALLAPSKHLRGRI